MLLLDSGTVPRAERLDVVTTVMAEASAATVTLDRNSPLLARMEVWRLGRVQLFRNSSSGISMSRNTGQARRGGTPIVALAVQERSWACTEQFGHLCHVAPGDLMMVDLTAPFAFSWRSLGASRALQLPIDELELPMDVIRSAGTRLGASPLAGLMARHIVDLFQDADRIAADPQAGSVGAASLELARALLASAAAGQGPHTAAAHDTLLVQIREYVRQHLRDPDLGPDSIAAAHNISVRHLYVLCARAGLRLEPWIIDRRLEGAFEELARLGAERWPIASVARRWGFRDPAHFARRFKSAYGMTPRERRALAVESRRA